MERIPMVLADEHAQVRTQILARLGREADLNVVGVAESSAATLACARATHPRLVLIDPIMSDGQGMDTIRRLRHDMPNTAIVVLSAFTDTAAKIELGKLGVRFILNKGIESYRLVQLLHEAVQF